MPTKKVTIVLYYLEATASIRMIPSSFGVAVCTVSSVTSEVCGAITDYLGPQYLYLPRNENETETKFAEFEAKFGMTQAFSAIDGTHIPIKCPDCI